MTVLTDGLGQPRHWYISLYNFPVASGFKMEEQEVEENPPVRPYKSLHSFVESPVRFINRTGREVHVIWINYEGKEVLKTTLLTNKKLDLNTFMTHPWIAVDSKTNERMLLNFRKTYLPGEPEVRRMDFEHRKAYVARAQVLITLPGKDFHRPSLRSG